MPAHQEWTRELRGRAGNLPALLLIYGILIGTLIATALAIL